MSYFHYEELKSFLSVKETAVVLNVSISTVYRMINTGEIKGTRINKSCIRIKAEEIIRYINRQ